MRSRGKEYRPVANFLLSKRIDLDRRTKSEGYVSKSPISCKLPLGSSGLHRGQAVNGASETYQCRSIEDEIDADHHTNKEGAG